MAYDPITGLLRKAGNSLTPDTDPTGQYGLGQYGAAPAIGGISPTSPTGSGSYAKILRTPGTMPDFLGILNSDPLLQQFKANSGAEQVADHSQLTAARQRALAQFGLVPDFSNALGLVGSDIGDDVTPETRALAQQNTAEGLSTSARLQREYDRVQQNIQDALAARGGLRSGALGIALKDLQQDHKQSLSDAEQQLMDYLSGVQAAYVQSQRQRAQQLSQEQAAAAGRIDPSRLYGTQGIEATHIGNGIYRSADGRLWNADGTPYNGAPPTASAPVAPTPAPSLIDRLLGRAGTAAKAYGGGGGVKAL